jgi:hypothetical protein
MIPFRRMREYQILATLILVLFLGACDSSCRTTPPQKGKTVFVLFDISSSTGKGQIRQRYLQEFNHIVEGIGSGDIIVVDVITDNPLAQSTFPVNESFDSPKFDTDNPLIVNAGVKKHEEELKLKRGEIGRKVESILSDSSQKINQTKILESMQLADRVFHTYKRPKNVLVVFSDMIEESGRYNFQTQRVSDATIQHILNDEKQNKRLPDLTGVRVYVVGAGSSNYQRSTASSFAEIEDFWLRYFREVGADLPKERYGAALLNFDE